MASKKITVVEDWLIASRLRFAFFMAQGTSLGFVFGPLIVGDSLVEHWSSPILQFFVGFGLGYFSYPRFKASSDQRAA